VALQPFVGPWPLLQFRNHFYIDCRIPWTGDQSVARPLPTHRTTKTHKNSHTDIHALSGTGTHDPSIIAEKTVHALDGAATVIGRVGKHLKYNTLFHVVGKPKKILVLFLVQSNFDSGCIISHRLSKAEARI
jgi:hypothetical protein